MGKGIQTLNVQTGNIAVTFDPVLSGGEFDGVRLDAVPVDVIVSVREASETDGGSELVLWGSQTGLNVYNIGDGTLAAVYNPTLSGGPFDGMAITDLTNNVNLLSLRKREARELALFSAGGISLYNIETGEDSNFTRDVALQGGDYDGVRISQLPVEQIIGVRDTLASELAVLGPSGVNFYDVDIGISDQGPYNPTMVLGDYAGQSFSKLENNTQIVGIRGTAGAQLSTFSILPPPIGWVWVNGQGWWYFTGPGPRWIDGEPPQSGEAVYIYDIAFASWVWASPDIYPWLYEVDAGDWIYWLGSFAGTRWFYSNTGVENFTIGLSQ